MKILKEAYVSWNAEGKCSSVLLGFVFVAPRLTLSCCTIVVFITSNYAGNSEMIQGCKEAGIPAFGTLWDFVSISYFGSKDRRRLTPCL